jgi:imidazolonepropionase-like amidohydrolase
MHDQDVALVPTFAVVDQILSPEGMDLDPATEHRVDGVHERMASALRISRAAGLRIGLGSDLIGPHQRRRGEEPRLRSELESPMQALVSATSVNANILGVEELVGMVRVGMQADMVAWQNDPLEDAKAFADPEMAVLVVKNGRVVKDIR